MGAAKGEKKGLFNVILWAGSSIGQAIIGGALAWAVGQLLLPPVLQALQKGGAERKNYCGELIPTAGGLAIVFATVSVIALTGMAGHPLTGVFLFVFLGFALLGLLDDWIGLNGPRGWRGHLGYLRAGEISSGTLKMLGGGLLGIGAALALPLSLVTLIPAAAVIALFANTCNLLDLRPGRCLKVALIFCILLLLGDMDNLGFLAPLCGALLAFLPYDLARRAMLGDCGANAVGAGIGLAAVVSMTPVLIGVLAISLLVFNLYCEKHSFSVAVRNNSFLAMIDAWGGNGEKMRALPEGENSTSQGGKDGAVEN